MSFLDDYEPVEDRLREFWADHPDGRIDTELIHHADGAYIVKASVWREDLGDDGLGKVELYHPSATGLAHDSEDRLPANMKASALEVCETSAIGRALANLGYAAKGKRPSREEMSKASSLGAPSDPLVSSLRSGGDISAPQAAAAGTVEHGADGGDGVDSTSSVPPEQSGGAGRVTGKGTPAPSGCKHLNGIDVDGKCLDCGQAMKVA